MSMSLDTTFSERVYLFAEYTRCCSVGVKALGMSSNFDPRFPHCYLHLYGSSMYIVHCTRPVARIDYQVT